MAVIERRFPVIVQCTVCQRPVLVRRVGSDFTVVCDNRECSELGKYWKFDCASGIGTRQE